MAGSCRGLPFKGLATSTSHSLLIIGVLHSSSFLSPLWVWLRPLSFCPLSLHLSLFLSVLLCFLFWATTRQNCIARLDILPTFNTFSSPPSRDYSIFISTTSTSAFVSTVHCIAFDHHHHAPPPFMHTPPLTWTMHMPITTSPGWRVGLSGGG